MRTDDPHKYLKGFWSKTLPGIKQLAWRNFRTAFEVLPDHTHDGALEIVFVPKGEMIYSIGPRMYQVRGGDFFIAGPDVVHGTGGLPMGVGEIYWTEIAMDRIDGFLGLAEPFATDLRDTLRVLPSGLHTGNKAMFAHLEALFEILPTKSRARIAQAHGHYLGLLGEVSKCVEGRLVSSEREWSPVFDAIEASLADPPSLAELAELVSLSESRFKVLFKEFCGISPAEYIVRRKIERSKVLLKRAEAMVIEVAVDLGFSSSQYFSSVFRKYVGLTPREFRKGMSPRIARHRRR